MSDINMFKCDRCSYETKRKSDLKQHVKQVHDKIKDHCCTQCDYKASRKGDLNRHVKMIHLKIKDKICSVCEKGFSRQDELKQHFKSAHNPNKYDKCVIYKITDLTNGNYYIGSSYMTTEKRLKLHESGYKQYIKNNASYCSSYDIIKNGNYTINHIFYVKCKNDKELKQIEDSVLKNNLDLTQCVNKNRSSK